ncbi:hypothetical protein CU044_5771 [Streptomyces sp. L-9-10]|nr:hypothetical protein CU044_5771 [Streptomyces sp. L-9-10]
MTAGRLPATAPGRCPRRRSPASRRNFTEHFTEDFTEDFAEAFLMKTTS